LLAAKQELESSYTKLALAKERVSLYGKIYLGDLEKMLALTRKAYESGEMSIFEFTITRERTHQRASDLWMPPWLTSKPQRNWRHRLSVV
jgi:hypothetical protein